MTRTPHRMVVRTATRKLAQAEAGRGGIRPKTARNRKLVASLAPDVTYKPGRATVLPIGTPHGAYPSCPVPAVRPEAELRPSAVAFNEAQQRITEK